MKKYTLALILFFFTSSLYSEREWNLVKPRVDLEWIGSINCYDSLNCFAFSRVISNSVVYQSKDKGENWFKIFENEHKNDSIWNLYHGYSLDSNNLYYYYLDRAILEKSNDGAKTFERISFGEVSNSEYNKIYDMKMYNTDYGIALTEHELIITNNSWKNYKIIPISYTNYFGYNFFFIDSNNIGLIKYYRRNNDLTKYNIENNEWTDYYLGKKADKGQKEKVINNIYFLNDTLGFACGWQETIENENFSKNIIWKTTNKGKNWVIVLNELHNPKTGLMQLSFKDENHGIAVGGWGAIVETVDGGKTWKYIEPPIELRGPALKVEWVGDYSLFASCCSGIYRLDPWVKSVEKDIIKQEKIKIRQSNDKLLISITDKKYRQHKIEIYNLQGIKLNEHSLSSGFGTLFQPVRIDQYPTGAYFYRISVDGELIHSGKFIK